MPTPNFSSAQMQFTIAPDGSVAGRFNQIVIPNGVLPAIWVQGIPSGTFTLWIGNEFQAKPTLTAPLLLRWELWLGDSCRSCGNQNGCWWEDWPVAAVPMLVGPNDIARAGRVFEMHAGTFDNALVQVGVIAGEVPQGGLTIPWRFDWKPQETGPFPRVTIGAPVG